VGRLGNEVLIDHNHRGTLLRLRIPLLLRIITFLLRIEAPGIAAVKAADSVWHKHNRIIRARKPPASAYNSDSATPILPP
jgi:hypothetical protein